MKKIYLKYPIFGTAMVIIIFAFFLIMGCQQEDINNESLPFLDITSRYDDLSSADFFILKLAFERVDPFIVENAGELKLKINSGDIINISNNLFQLIITSINKSNNLLYSKNFFISEKNLIPSNIDLSKVVRLKSGYEGGSNDPTQTEYYWWGMNETTSLNQQSAYDYYHNFENTGKIQSAIAGAITSFISWPVGLAVTIGGFTFSYAQGNAIYSAAQSGGITIECMTIYGQMDPSTPGSGTTTRIKDSHGNTVLIY